MSSKFRYRPGSRNRLVRASRKATVALAVAAAGALASGAVASAAEVNIVRQGKPPAKVPAGTHYFTTIQKAVEASTPGDYVLIEPGTYDEEVKVTERPDIWIRGMNRNKVIIDGQHRVGNGIEIKKSDNVWVENLTVRNFEYGEKCPDEECGNGIWWTGGKDSGLVGAHGWYGSYLTAYDTGMFGGYGIFTQNETEGSWEHIYASGYADSGMYIGACQECDARVNDATMEKNALGYSGSNAGGKLVLENGVYRANMVGIAPNSENPGDSPPPQDGQCERTNPTPEHPEPPNPTPIITTTQIPRCTIIRNNLITENDNLTVPVNGSTGIAPWGAGVELPGDYADLVENNVISRNGTDGVLGFEYPNPINPEALFKGEYPFFEDTKYFQLAGNAVTNNVFTKNGFGTKLAGPFTGDIALMGGFSEFFDSLGFPYPESHSENNCASNNVLVDGTFPANIQGTWGCQNATTPSPGGSLAAIEYLGGLQAEANAIREAQPPVGQPAPPPQKTMPNPCQGVPSNPLCP